jgi:Tol biopolymer transport system component
MAMGTTTRVSTATDGMQGNDYSAYPSISVDGRYVAFESNADNLLGNGKDTNSYSDVFVRDTVAKTTSRISVASDGTQGNYYSDYPSISSDGRYVAFRSFASNLMDNDANGGQFVGYDVFVRDVVNGTTTLVSVATDGTQGNGDSYIPRISADGRYVAFPSYADNLVDDDANGAQDIFVRGPLVSGTRPPYTIAEVAQVLRFAAGLSTPDADDVAHLDAETVSGRNALDTADAVTIARKVAGLDGNPRP